MATLRDVLNKISAIKKTRQITKAMNMVAAAKLRSAQGRMESFKPYASKFSEVLNHLSSLIESDTHPLLGKKQEIKKIELLHFSADRGLCGSFNVNSINSAEKWLKNLKSEGIEGRLITVGKKGSKYFSKHNYDILNSYNDLYGKVDISFANKITKGLVDRYLADEVDEVYMMYSRFISVVQQEPTFVQLIPIVPPEEEQKESGFSEYLCEPNAPELLVELLPKHISVQIFDAFLQNETSEHAARMASMENASKNCDDLIEHLTLMYNKARQAAITAELMDIVGGAEALK